MADNLDYQLHVLKAEPTPAAYKLIETRAWREIAAVRRARQTAPALYAMRTATVVVALALGVASGGAAAMAVANERQEVAAFSVVAELAPSTLLDSHR